LKGDVTFIVGATFERVIRRSRRDMLIQSRPKRQMLSALATLLALAFLVATTHAGAHPDDRDLLSGIAHKRPSFHPPPEACLRRLLATVDAMAGVVNPTLEDDRPDARSWLERIDEATTNLRSTFAAERQEPVAIESMIVTIADPIDSGLVYTFESALQAVRRAVERTPENRQPFYRDRSWLPWDDQEVPSEERKALEACRHSTPGIMLFHGGSPQRPEIFVLLLVGESPTSGVRQAALLNALSLQARFQGEPTETASGVRVVRIIGPMFSGSAQSVALALRNWAGTKSVRFHVTSGTATGSAVPGWLRRTVAGQAAIEYSATAVPEATVECAYLWFLRARLGVGTVEAVRDGPGNELEGVATLTESGTEFGNTTGSAGANPRQPPDGARSPGVDCKWAPASSLRFPFHISSLRDAYEALDHVAAQGRKEPTVARATSLAASLKEGRAPVDVDGSPSAKTRAAEDITLRNLLDYVTTSGIRHLAVHATDIGDAIFLSRKLRDAAPDVRLAFFEADALLLHPTYRADLVGSLVVSPYPFLGASGLSDGSPPLQVTGFENGNAQGLYNAVLAQRFPARESLGLLRNYSLGSDLPLPIWISTIGRGSFVPTKVTPTRDCDAIIHGTVDPNPADEVCNTPSPQGAWTRFNQLKSADLRLESDAAVPHTWDFLLVLLVFALWLDVKNQNQGAARLATDLIPSAVATANDPPLDRAIGRTKWLLYGSIRSFLFVLVFGYVGVLNCFALIARGGLNGEVTFLGAYYAVVTTLVAAGGFVAAAIVTFSVARRYRSDYQRFAECVGATWWSWRSDSFPKEPSRDRSPNSAPPTELKRMPPSSHPPSGPMSSRLLRVSSIFGFVLPLSRLEVARTSFAQLRFLTVSTLALACLFSVLLVVDTLRASAAFASDWGRIAVPEMTMLVLRNTRLGSGVSPSAPALLCIACVYVWAVGRMARLGLAHGTSRISPPDLETDLVCTPIRLILFPGYAIDKAGEVVRGSSDEGFTAIERDLCNAIWRPITGRYYVTAAFTAAAFPAVLFLFIKPLSTLESAWGTVLLGLALGLAVFLIGVTLIQLVRYWASLEQLLKRAMEHRLGPAFRSVPVFARDSVDHQVSRSPTELLRWAACARQFCELVDSARDVAEFSGICDADERHELERLRRDLKDSRVHALEGQSVRTATHAAETAGVRSNAIDGNEARPLLPPPEIALCEATIDAAKRVSDLLERQWQRERTAAHALVSEAQPRDLERATQPSMTTHAAAGDASRARAQLVQPRSTDSQPAPPDQRSAGGQQAPDSGEREASPGNNPRNASGGKSRTSSADWADAFTPIEVRFTKAELCWLRSAQTFVATVVTLLVHRHVRQFRIFVHVLTLCTLLLLLAVTSYPFEPYRLIITFMWVVMGSVVAASLWIFIQMDRNTLMSHISGTAPNEVTLNGAFYFRVFAWTIVPLISVAAAQYPEVADVLMRIVSPLAPALR
jgi:hypothetical protein